MSLAWRLDKLYSPSLGWRGIIHEVFSLSSRIPQCRKLVYRLEARFVKATLIGPDVLSSGVSRPSSATKTVLIYADS